MFIDNFLPITLLVRVYLFKEFESDKNPKGKEPSGFVFDFAEMFFEELDLAPFDGMLIFGTYLHRLAAIDIDGGVVCEWVPRKESTTWFQDTVHLYQTLFNINMV